MSQAIPTTQVNASVFIKIKKQWICIGWLWKNVDKFEALESQPKVTKYTNSLRFI